MVVESRIRESSFNMTRGEKISRGGAPKIFRHPNRGAPKKLGRATKICILQNQQEGGAPKKLNKLLNAGEPHNVEQNNLATLLPDLL